MEKNRDFLIFVLSIIVIVLSIASMGVSLSKGSDLIQKLTGFAMHGYVNISILSTINVNLSVDRVYWGPGTINSGETNATIYTVGNGSGVVQRGNWSGLNVNAFRIENLGNVNCSLSVQTGKDAHDFFNSLTNSNEQYMLNVSNKEPGSCTGNLLNQWVDVNKTTGGTRFCNELGFHKSQNEIYLNVLLTIPYDAGNIGEQSDSIVITGDVTN